MSANPIVHAKLVHASVAASRPRNRSAGSSSTWCAEPYSTFALSDSAFARSAYQGPALTSTAMPVADRSSAISASTEYSVLPARSTSTTLTPTDVASVRRHSARCSNSGRATHHAAPPRAAPAKATASAAARTRRTCLRSLAFDFLATTASCRRFSAASCARAIQSMSGSGPPSGSDSGATLAARTSSNTSLVRTIATTKSASPSAANAAGPT